MKKILFILLLTIPFFLSSCRQKDESDLIEKVFRINSGVEFYEEIYIKFVYRDVRGEKTRVYFTHRTPPPSLKGWGMGEWRIEGDYVWLSENTNIYLKDGDFPKKYPLSIFIGGKKFDDSSNPY